MTRVRRAARWPVLLLIRFYQRAISPWTPPSCRYYPSCSQYAYVAVERHGLLRGGWLAVRRVGRCHPWAAGGVDHVPPARGSVHASAVADPDATAAAVHSAVHSAVPSDIPTDIHRVVPTSVPTPVPNPVAGAAAVPTDPMIARGA